MNKTDWIAATAEAAGMSKKDTERVLNAAIDTLCKSLVSGEKVQISGFGTFETKVRQPRVGRNPVTRESVEIPAATVPTFKPSKNLKDLVGK